MIKSQSFVTILGQYEPIVKQLLSLHADIPFTASEATSEFLTRQKLLIRKKRDDNTIDARAVLLLKDCKTLDINIRMAVLNGMSLRIFLIMAFQTITNVYIPPYIRSNSDFVIIANETSLANQRKLYDDYASMFETFDHFCEALNAITYNGNYMVLDNCADSNKLMDQVFILYQ